MIIQFNDLPLSFFNDSLTNLHKLININIEH